MGKVIDATLRFVDQFTKPMGMAVGEMQRSSKQFIRAGREIERAGEKISKTGGKLTKSVTVPIVGIGVTAIKTAADFQESMSKVQSISGASAKDMELLTAKAKEMGAKTKFSATESADAFSYMAMAGWEAADMLNSIEAVMYLAGASGTNLAQTTDIVTDAMTAFGLKADEMHENGVAEATHFTNVLAAAANKSNTSVAMMGESFQYAAPIAGALGYSVDDTAIALGLMANAGIKASQSGTAMRGAFANMVNPSDKMAAAMDRLGISATNGDGSMKTLKETMDMLRNKMKTLPEAEREQALAMLGTVDSAELAKEAMKGLSEEEIAAQTALGLGLEAIKEYDEAQLNSALSKAYTQQELKKLTEEEKRTIVAMEQGKTALAGLTKAEQAQAASTIFGKNAMSGMLAIINASEDDYNKLSEAIGSCDMGDGAAKTMYGIANDNLNGRITVLKSTLESIAITIGEKLMPFAEKAVEKIQSLADAFTNLDDKTIDTVMKIAGIAAAVGPALVIFGKLVSTVGKAAKTFGKAGKAIKTFGSIGKAAFGLLTTPAGIVVGVLAAIVAAGVLVYKNWDKIKKAARELGNRIKDSFTNSGIDVGKLKDKFIEMKDRVGIAIGDLKIVIGKIKDALKPVISFVKDVFVARLDAGFKMVIGAASGVLTGITDIASGVISIFGGITRFLSGVFTGNWSKAWNGVKDILKGVCDSFVGIIKTPLNGMIGLINGAINSINKVKGSIPEWVPVFGGKEFGLNLPNIPMLAKGTNYWQGGLAITQEKGAEIMDLPRGTRVYPHDKSLEIARKEGVARGKGNITIHINKLADKMEVRNESDIDKIAEAMVKKLTKIANNGGGEPA